MDNLKINNGSEKGKITQVSVVEAVEESPNSQIQLQRIDTINNSVTQIEDGMIEEEQQQPLTARQITFSDDKSHEKKEDISWLLPLLKQQDSNLGELAKEAENARIVNQPEFKILDVCCRSGFNGTAELVRLVKVPRVSHTIDLPYGCETIVESQSQYRLQIGDQHTIELEITDPPLPFISEAGVEKYLHSGGFGGDQDDIFWFSRSGQNLTLTSIDPGSTDLTKFIVPDTSSLYNHITVSSTRDIKQSGWRGMPKMIRDAASQKRIIVFSHEKNSVKFYDVMVRRETVQVDGAQLFLYQYTKSFDGCHTRDYFLLMADPFINMLSDGSGGSMEELSKKYRKHVREGEGYPTIRRCGIDFSSLRQQQGEPLKINMAGKQAEDMLKSLEGLGQRERERRIGQSNHFWIQVAGATTPDWDTFCQVLQQDNIVDVMPFWQSPDCHGYALLSSSLCFVAEVRSIKSVVKRFESHVALIQESGAFWMPVNDNRGELTAMLHIDPQRKQFELSDLTNLNSQRGAVRNGAWLITVNRANSIAIADGHGIFGEFVSQGGNVHGTFKIPPHRETLDFKKQDGAWQFEYRAPILAYHHPGRPCDLFVVNLRNKEECKQTNFVQLRFTDPLHAFGALQVMTATFKPSFGLITQAEDSQCYMELTLDKPLSKDSIQKSANWTIQTIFEEIDCYIKSPSIWWQNDDFRGIVNRQGADTIALFDVTNNHSTMLYRPQGTDIQLNSTHQPIIFDQTRLLVIETETIDGNTTDHIVQLQIKGEQKRLFSLTDGTTVLAIHHHLGQNLHVLDSNLCLIVLKDFMEVSRRSLDHIIGLKQATEHCKVYLSEHVVMANGVIFSLATSSQFSAIEDSTSAMQAYDSILVHQSSNGEVQVIQNLPDSRRLSLFGDEAFWKCVMKVIQISSDKVLLLLGNGDQGWSGLLMTLDGDICEQDQELEAILGLKNWTHADSVYIKDGHNQIVLVCEEDEIILEALVLTLQSDGKLESWRQLNLTKDVKGKLLQNQNGDLMEVILKASEMSYTPVGLDDKYPAKLTLDVSSTTEFAYLGNYLCWLCQDDPTVYIHDLKQERKAPHVLDLSQYVQSHGLKEVVRIDPISPHEQARKVHNIAIHQLQASSQNLQVTVGNRALVFQISLQPTLISDQSVQHLLDPEQFVDSAQIRHRTLQLSPFGNLVFYSGDKLGIYRRYSRLDIFEAEKVLNWQGDDTVDIRMLWATFGSENVLSMLAKTKDEQVLRDIVLTLKSSKLLLEPSNLLRLKQALNFKTIVEQRGETIQMTSTLTNLLLEPAKRDFLLELGMLCPDFSILEAFVDQQSFMAVLNSPSSIAMQSMNSAGCMRQSYTMMDWPMDQCLMTFRSNSLAAKLSTYSKGLFERRAVSAKIFDLAWLGSSKSGFAALTTLIDHRIPESLIQTELVQGLLDLFWSNARLSILLKQALPYAFYAFITTWYLHESQQADSDATSAGILTLAIITLVLSIYHIYAIVLQLKHTQKASLQSFFTNIMNWTDFSALVLILLITVTQLDSQDWIQSEHLRRMSAFANFFVLIKIPLYWLRLIPATEFYTIVLREVFMDLKWFIFVLFLLFISTSVPMATLDVIEDKTGSWLLDVLFSHYLLMLKLMDQSILELEGPEAVLSFLVFATIALLGLAMINILIAVVGDAYTRVHDNSIVFKARNRLQILNQHSFVLPNEENLRYLFVLKPIEDDSNDGDINEVEQTVQRVAEDIKVLSNKFACWQKKGNEQMKEIQATMLKEKLQLRKENAEIKEMLSQVLIQVSSHATLPQRHNSPEAQPPQSMRKIRLTGQSLPDLPADWIKISEPR